MLLLSYDLFTVFKENKLTGFYEYFLTNHEAAEGVASAYQTYENFFYNSNSNSKISQEKSDLSINSLGNDVLSTLILSSLLNNIIM